MGGGLYGAGRFCVVLLTFLSLLQFCPLLVGVLESLTVLARTSVSLSALSIFSPVLRFCHSLPTPLGLESSWWVEALGNGPLGLGNFCSILSDINIAIPALKNRKQCLPGIALSTPLLSACLSY